MILFLLALNLNVYATPKYPTTLSILQECWNSKQYSCIRESFGSPAKITTDAATYLDGENEYLTVFLAHDQKKNYGDPVLGIFSRKGYDF